MRRYRLKNFETELLERVQASRGAYDRTREDDIHLSEIIYCLDTGYYKRKLSAMGIRPPPDRRSQLLFTRGRAIGELLALIGESQEVKAEWEGIVGTIDVELNVPVEIKSTIGGSKSPPKLWDNWLRQIKGYCVMRGDSSGIFVVLKLMHSTVVEDYYNKMISRRDPELFAYRLVFTEDEMEEQREWMRMRRDTLVTALETDTPPGCDEDFFCTSTKTSGCHYLKAKYEREVAKRELKEANF